MKLKRIDKGHYRSADGRVMIRRGPARRWCVNVDGNTLPDERTKTAAVQAVERELNRRDGRAAGATGGE